MAFNVVLYSGFTKPDNSTRLPDTGDTFPCLVVEPCGVINPRISLANGVAWNPSKYNYAYIQEWRRYYWVNEWTFDSGRWYVELTVDTLTSFKDEILSREEYIVRSASEYDLSIIDQLYPAKAEYRVVNGEFRPFAYNTLRTGTFVLGVANGRSSSVGGVTYYCGSQDDMSSLFEFMYSSTDWLNGADIDDISDDLLKCLVEPAQFLSSLMWFPLSVDQVKSQYGGYVGAGWWQTDVNLNYAQGMVVLEGQFNRGSHPQQARGTYLNYQPYTVAKMYVPPFGSVEINLEKYPPNSTVKFQIQIDTVTGAGMLFIYPEGAPVGSGQQFFAQIGVSIAITSMQSDILGAITTVGTTVAHSSNIASAVFGTIGAVADAAKLVSPDVTVVGTNGNMSVYQNNASLTATYKMLVDEDLLHHGRPLFKKKKLGDLTGFTQVRDFDTNLPCTLPEQKIIKNYLEGGIFIE